MKYFLIALVLFTLPSCWMLEQPEFMHTETVTLALSGVIASGSFISLYNGILDVCVSIIVTTVDDCVYSKSQTFTTVLTDDECQFNIYVETESKIMLSYRIIFSYTMN
jgi:hypothetical protein